MFVAVTSQADDATGKAFPIGRWINGAWEKYSTGKEGETIAHTPAEQRDANINTIGHAERYRTHRLDYAPSKRMDAKIEQKAADTGNCGCPYHSGIENLLAGANFPTEYNDWKTNLKNDGDWKIDMKYKSKDPDSSPDNPFWVVCTGKDVIPDHNGFYTPLFLNFVRHVYDDSLHLWNLQNKLNPRPQ